MIVGVDRRLASQRRARELAAAVGDHLVHVHVELRSASRHPYVQRKHVVMLAAQNFVADLHNQLVVLAVKLLAAWLALAAAFFRMA